MEDLGIIWTNQENVNVLEQKLMWLSCELESARIEANEEISKNKENIKQLLKFLRLAYQERDEARNQLKKFLHNFIPSNPTDQLCTKQIVSQKANSSITESNSLSEAHNPYSTSSPVDSFFDSVSSPDLSNMNLTDSSNSGFLKQPPVQDFNGSSLPNTATVAAGLFSRETDRTNQETKKVDHGTMMSPTAGLFSREANKMMIDEESLILYSLAKGRPLPQKGNLLKAVMEAGPLLQTLLVAGPLPRWRNPPPVEAFQVPQVSVEGIDESSNGCNLGERSMNSLNNYTSISCGSSQIYPTSMLDFAGGASGLLLHSGRMLSSGVNFICQIPMGKRQRIK